MKALRFAALGAALAFGATTAIAQPPAGTTTGQPTAGQHRGMRGMHGGPRGGDRLGGALFQGVTLTDAQKQQVRTIRQKYAEQRRSLFGQARPQGTTPAQRTRPDSATRVQMRSQAQELMQREIAETRSILSVDQQRTFDQNVATMRQRGQERGLKARRQGTKRPGA